MATHFLPHPAQSKQISLLTVKNNENVSELETKYNVTENRSSLYSKLNEFEVFNSVTYLLCRFRDTTS
jgi:hypothetical protein